MAAYSFSIQVPINFWFPLFVNTFIRTIVINNCKTYYLLAPHMFSYKTKSKFYFRAAFWKLLVFTDSKQNFRPNTLNIVKTLDPIRYHAFNHFQKN